MKKTPTISLCMIVRNEEEVLARCLASVGALADEIIIVDTGSTDRTVEIATSFGARVCSFEWIDDFAAARNFSFSLATQSYILWLDADDLLLPADRDQLLALKEHLDKDIYYLKYDYAQDGAGRPLCLLHRERLVRRSATGRWQYPIHEVYGDPEAKESAWPDITVTHNRTYKGSHSDEHRNLRIMRRAMRQQRYAQDARMLYYYGRELHDAGRHAAAVRQFQKFLEKEGWSEDRYTARVRMAECWLELAQRQHSRAAHYMGLARAQAVLALQQEATRPEAKFILGQIAFRQALYSEAIHWYEQCLVPVPAQGGIVNTYYYGLGPTIQLMFCYDRLGQYARAMQYNESALALRPGDPGLLNNRDYFSAKTTPDILPQPPEVDIIIPTLGNWDYLRAALESVAACTDVSYRVIIVHSGGGDVPSDLPGRPLVVCSGAQLYFAQAINLGLQHSSADMICLLNDDVIATRNWLSPMLVLSRQKNAIVHPLSNNNTGWLHEYPLPINGIDLAAHTWRLQAGCMVADNGAALHPAGLYDAVLQQNRTFDTPWVPFFCAVFPRTLVHAIGLLDEAFINGCEDMDYCKRAAGAGFSTIVLESSFVFHFGSVTLSELQRRYPYEYTAIDRSNHHRAAIQERLIVIRAGHTFHPWHPRQRRTTGLGGAETAVVALATALQSRGNRMLVFGYFGNNEGTVDGVEYWDDARFEGFQAQYSADIFIASRHASMLHRPVRARQTYLWLHDLVAVDTTLGADDIVPRYADSLLSRIVCLSPWHRDYAAQAHGLNPQKIAIIGNGINEEMFSNICQRDPYRLLYTSCPSRGLAIALDIFQELKKECPQARLDVYGSFTNWLDRAKATQDEAALELIARLQDRLAKEEGVHLYGAVSQPQLAEACMSGGIWFYPCTVPETYCIAALEAQAAGMYCITSGYGALPTTISPDGHIIHEMPGTPAFQQTALRLLLQCIGRNDEAMRTRIRNWALQFSWTARAAEWERLFLVQDHAGASDRQYTRLKFKV